MLTSVPAGVLAADGELHTFHCLFGCPLGAPATNDTIVREIYTLSSNDLTKVADWVAYRVTPTSIGSSGERTWQADPWLSADETLTPPAYDGAHDASASIAAIRRRLPPSPARRSRPTRTSCPTSRLSRQRSTRVRGTHWRARSDCLPSG